MSSQIMEIVTAQIKSYDCWLTHEGRITHLSLLTASIFPFKSPTSFSDPRLFRKSFIPYRV